MSIPAPLSARSQRRWRLFVMLLLAVSGCQPAPDAWRFEGRAMGTSYSVIVVPVDGVDRVALREDVEATIGRVEDRFSTYRRDSEVSRFNAMTDTEWVPVSKTLCDAFAATLQLSQLTEGSFDITVAPLVDAWGFGPGEDVYEPLNANTISALIDSVGFDKLEIDCEAPAARKSNPNVQVDFSAWAKGHAIDSVAEALDSSGIRQYLVELGGEIRTSGRNAAGQAWTIALADPDAPDRPLPLRVAMHRAAIATSGDYANYFTANGKRYAHVIDPRTGYPTGHALTAVTVIDGTAARADALATALLVLGPEDGFTFATRHRLAASFLSREAGGFTRRSTTAFEPYMAIGETN